MMGAHHPHYMEAKPGQLCAPYIDQAFADLRPDQRKYVVQCMDSWRAHRGFGWYNPGTLRRAIRKAKQNRP
jgi:hypothetical protein